MAVREIVLMGDPVLRTPAEEVETFDEELRELVRDMFETMHRADGVGLAAPQVGVSLRVLVVDVREESDDSDAGRARLALVNPEVVTASEETAKGVEGCLSIPGLEDVVERPARVEVRGFDPEGNEVTVAAEELFGRVLQHEIDHLEGILFVDRLSPLKRRMLLKKWKKSQEDS